MELYEVGIKFEGMVAIFSTLEKAQSYVDKMSVIDSESYYIDTVVVDKWV